MLRVIGLLVAGLALWPVSGANLHHKIERNLPALDPKLENSIPNGEVTLYYNSSGPVPGYNVTTPAPPPITPFKGDVKEYFAREIRAINDNNTSPYNTTCQRCLASTQVLHFAAITQSVDTFTDLMIEYCEAAKIPIGSPTCFAQYSPKSNNQSAYSSDAGGGGPYYAQFYSKLNSETGDMQALCYYRYHTCTKPPVIQIDESRWFGPKPEAASISPEPSGQTFNVLHLSDTHFDPRYDIGSEGNCSSSPCCRPYSTNQNMRAPTQNPSIPASRYGNLNCDTPPDLLISTFTSMDQFFNKSDVSFALFTGDIVSHDANDRLSKEYIEYAERSTFDTFKAQLGGIPVYATLGNHDTLPQGYNAPNNINDDTGNDDVPNAMSWNYELVSSMWQNYGWIAEDEAQYASSHYGGYAHTTTQGLRIISINTDFWCSDNFYNYFNFTNPDQSGILKFLADELSACETRGQRAWVIGHVPTGYDASSALPNPTALFYSIVRRFSPATIAGVFFGHTHEDQMQIFYDYNPTSLSNNTIRNTSDVDYSKPLQMGFIAPSVVPLDTNAGYQLLQVDSKTFSVMNRQTYFSNVSESLEWDTPVWKFEYDARQVFNVGGINWAPESPLNATFFDKVTGVMLNNQTLVEEYNLLEMKSSPLTQPCSTPECAKQKVCYIRSASAELGKACGAGQGPR